MSKMFDVWKMIEGMEVGHQLHLISSFESDLTLVITKEDNTTCGYSLTENRERELFKGGKVTTKKSSIKVKNAHFSVEGLQRLQYEEGDLQGLIFFKYVTDPQTFESKGAFDNEEGLEMFVLGHFGRYYVCGLEGFFFEIREPEVSEALLRLPCQKVLNLKHLIKMPAGLEDVLGERA